MPVFITRFSAFALLAAALLPGLGCSGGALGDLLDPTKTKKSEGFDNGVGGGQVIKDLFPGARFVREAPKITDFQPAADAKNVNIRSVIGITFSESINKSSVTADSVVLRESGGGGTPINVEQIFTQSQTVLVLAPDSNLKESTTYEVVVSSSVEDLQGQKLDVSSSGGSGSGGSGSGGSGGGGTGGGGTGGGGTGGGSSSTARYTFQTGVDDPNTKFSIVQVSPLNRAGFVYRLASAVVLL
ncbi:MAG: Ig-like domain-containing protein, partial [Planctomycetota bacterium]